MSKKRYTPEYEELCNQMHQWYTEGLILRDAPLTNAPNTRLMQMYGGVAFSHRVAEQNVVSVTRSTKQCLTSITLGNPNHQAPSPLVLAVLVALAVGMPPIMRYLAGKSNNDNTRGKK